MAQPGYSPSSYEPTNILCVNCGQPILEWQVANWLWHFNGLPKEPVCNHNCAIEWEEQKQDNEKPLTDEEQE